MEDDRLIELVQTPEFWREFEPGLSISDLPGTIPPIERKPKREERRRERLVEEGYAHVTDMDFDEPFELMAATMERIRDLGLPPAFIGVYDQPWILTARLRALMDEMFEGEAKLSPDFWAWVVRPGERGFPMHRDRKEGSLFENFHPVMLKVWMPLTKAAPENGGLSVVPANLDPRYTDLSQRDVIDPQTIRAIPAKPGEILIWTGRLSHMGGYSSTHAKNPRVSLSWEFQTASTPPLLGKFVESYPDMPFDIRLNLIASVTKRYSKASEDISTPLWQMYCDARRAGAKREAAE